MAAELIGLCRCPNPKCSSDRARLTLAKNNFPVLTCNACNLQAFARSDRSDEGFRSLLVASSAPAPVAPEPVRAAAAPAAPMPPPKPVRTSGWGVLAS